MHCTPNVISVHKYASLRSHWLPKWVAVRTMMNKLCCFWLFYTAEGGKSEKSEAHGCVLYLHVPNICTCTYSRENTYNNLPQELWLSDPDLHFRYLWMSKETFNIRFSGSSDAFIEFKVPLFQPAETRIISGWKNAITLRYLAKGKENIV